MRVLSWAFATRVVAAITLLAAGAQWGWMAAQGRHGGATAPSVEGIPRGPRGEGPAARIAAGQSAAMSATGGFLGPRGAGPGRSSKAWPIPSEAFEWCWPRGEACANAGLCNMPDPFEPRITSSQLAKCSRLSTDDSKGKALQLYHVSKCGGV